MPKLEVVNANNVIEYSPQKANFKLKNTGGPKGEPGAQGPKGDTGPQGPAGPQGIQGEKGDKGAQGERGPQGIQGPQGPQGIQGPKGDKGDKGNTGATGPQGPQGPAGQNGTNGQDGADGFSPIATVTQEGLDAEISITDKDGTTTATVPGFGVQTVATLPATGTENVIYLKRTESTASGKSISIADAVEAPLADFKLKGETSQNGTPTPDAPVPVKVVTGENVVKISDGQGNEQNYSISLGSIELCKIGDYQDYIYKSGDKWYVRKEVRKRILTGSSGEGWYRQGYGTNTFTTLLSYANDITQVGDTIIIASDHFYPVAWDARAQSTPNIIYPNLADGGRLEIRNTSWTTASDLNTWLAANPTTVYYALATPTDTEITNEALIEQLEAILSQGYTYAGTNNITTVITAGNEQGELEIGYYNAYDSYLYVAGRWQQFARLTAANE